jgi:hypothetical protein
MTDQPTPDLTAITAAAHELGENLLAAFRTAWARIEPAVTYPTRDDYALVPGPDAFETAALSWLAARSAFRACLDGDDQAAARLLDGLDAAQLYAIEGAASGLATHASRLRKTVDPAEQSPMPAFTCDCPPGRCLADPFPDGDNGEQPASADDLAARYRALDEQLTAERRRSLEAEADARRARAERDKERRRAESSEDQNARHMRWLNEARDAAGADNWPSIPAAIRGLGFRAEQAEATLDVVTRERDRIRERLAD